mmetsp:Transcript_23014/g.66970  ORF Transcript_23014/g.66970 Transcript_23014/m.66970 type:complete len:245 (+) Transcript_23014:580-1314(+)
MGRGLPVNFLVIGGSSSDVCRGRTMELSVQAGAVLALFSLRSAPLLSGVCRRGGSLAKWQVERSVALVRHMWLCCACCFRPRLCTTARVLSASGCMHGVGAWRSETVGRVACGTTTTESGGARRHAHGGHHIPTVVIAPPVPEPRGLHGHGGAPWAVYHGPQGGALLVLQLLDVLVVRDGLAGGKLGAPGWRALACGGREARQGLGRRRKHWVAAGAVPPRVSPRRGHVARRARGEARAGGGHD